jgi:hypothetical protein
VPTVGNDAFNAHLNSAVVAEELHWLSFMQIAVRQVPAFFLMLLRELKRDVVNRQLVGLFNSES